MTPAKPHRGRSVDSKGSRMSIKSKRSYQKLSKLENHEIEMAELHAREADEILGGVPDTYLPVGFNGK